MFIKTLKLKPRPLVGGILFAMSLMANAGITLTTGADTRLGEVISAIQSQSDYKFFYDDNIAKSNVRIVNLKDENVDEALKKLFDGTQIEYTVKDKIVYLKKTGASDSGKKAKTTPHKISGVILDENGDPLIGASVRIKGSAMGVATDIDGNYTIETDEANPVLECTYVGYKTKEIKTDGSDKVDVDMTPDLQVLNEVVVTALGIKREQKSLSYNVQQVTGESLSENKDANFINGLAGKVAGVNINASSSGVGGISKVVMRGTKSIMQSSNALYVVDGMPMRSANNGGSTEFGSQGATEPIADINPEDIESMSVLSGATAAALYGMQGANGVILITTKKGKAGGVRVNYSNSTTFSKPFVMPKFQNTYGTDFDANALMSWGPKLATPSSYDPKDFFQTGFNETNAVSVSSGNERTQIYASAASVNSRGIIPNNVYNRYNFSARATTELIQDRLTLDVGATYMKQYDRNSLVQGTYHNPLIGIYLFPRGDDIRKYQIYERYNGKEYPEQFWGLNFMNGVENPWWITNRQIFENRANRYTFNATMVLKATDWLTFTGRVRTDNTAMNYTRKLYASTIELFASEYGNYLNHKVNHNNLYADALMSIDKTFFDDAFSLQFNLGASLMDDKNSLVGYEGHLAGIANKFTYNNILPTDSQSIPLQEGYHDQTQAIYGTLQLGYKGMIYLDVTARNEWDSRLAFTRRLNIFYPSVGLSAVISSMTDLSKAGISFLKVRASYAEVGNAPERYITGRNYGLYGGVISTDNPAPATHLTPERTKSFEAGLNVKFLQNKIWADATYYNTNTYNQLFLCPTPPATGYKETYINAGKINNWGIEAVVGYKNTWGDFSWSTNVNFSMNRNKIKELVPEGTIDPVTGAEVELSEVNFDYGGFRTQLKKGGSIGDFYVTGLKTDDRGEIYVDPNSNTVLLDNKTYIYGGNTDARFRWGWNNQFGYKGISLGVLIDARIGGRGVSATQAMMDRFGVSEDSAIAREQGGVWVSPTQKIPDVQTFYNNSGEGMSMLSHYVYSMTNVRLRELTLGYDLPSKWFNDKVNMSVSFVGRNLFMFYNKAPFDPEITASTSTYYQGIDYFMQPSVRTLGFSVRLQF